MKTNYSEFYEKKLDEFGPTTKVLWNSSQSQIQRFQAMKGILDYYNRDYTLLDVGCGFGDLYNYLIHSDMIPKLYVGIDGTLKLIKIAESRHKSNIAKFIHIDFQDFYFNMMNQESASKHHRIPSKFDFVFASGLFGLYYHKDWDEHVGYVLEMCKQMFEIADVGVAVNFLSSFSPNSNDCESIKTSAYHYPPDLLHDIMVEVTTKVVLKHDYRKNDFTIYLLK